MCQFEERFRTLSPWRERKENTEVLSISKFGALAAYLDTYSPQDEGRVLQKKGGGGSLQPTIQRTLKVEPKGNTQLVTEGGGSQE
jgi:hypothetical protein